MNCRFTAFDARISSVTRELTIVRAALWSGMHLALHHCPGEAGSKTS
jgi:hypothetical protein